MERGTMAKKIIVTGTAEVPQGQVPNLKGTQEKATLAAVLVAVSQATGAQTVTGTRVAASASVETDAPGNEGVVREGVPVIMAPTSDPVARDRTA